MITPYLLYEDVAGAIKFLSKAFRLQEVREHDVRQERQAHSCGDEAR
jgi:uncharacterized glyoxalase superfamily protein PhnB